MAFTTESQWQEIIVTLKILDSNKFQYIVQRHCLNWLYVEYYKEFYSILNQFLAVVFQISNFIPFFRCILAGNHLPWNIRRMNEFRIFQNVPCLLPTLITFTYRYCYLYSLGACYKLLALNFLFFVKTKEIGLWKKKVIQYSQEGFFLLAIKRVRTTRIPSKKTKHINVAISKIVRTISFNCMY